MTILITGGAGFLGSHIADAMIKRGQKVIIVDSLVSGDIENIPHHAKFYHIDCDKRDSLVRIMADNKVDTLVHCAALAHEGLSVFSPKLITDNVYGASVSVFSAAIAAGVKKIVFTSSMARYGKQSGTGYFDESMSPLPVDPYGIAKVAAEQTLAALCKTHGVKYTILVPHNIIGPRQKYDDPFRNVAAIMINRMLQGKQPIIYGDGNQIRCFSFVDDCVSCFEKVIEEDFNEHVINIGPDEGAVTINTLSETLARLLEFKLAPIYVTERPCEVKIATCSSEKAKKILGYQTKVDMITGLGDMIDYIKFRGVKRFNYYLPLEIENEKTPNTWTKKLI